jgi:murein DD-endopeptidase MepM/ murein hydrolase activator NlpD
MPSSPSRRSAGAVRTRLPAALILVVVWIGSLGAAQAVGEPDPQGVWPLSPQPQVLRTFDPPGVVWGSGHRGVDLAARAGQEVRSATAGWVSFVGVIAGVPIVVVDTGTVRTTYQPVIAALARGTPVSAGQAVGTMALVGSHCAERLCLHWGLIRDADDVYLDPLSLIGLRRVRLLPLWRDQPVADGVVGRTTGGGPAATVGAWAGSGAWVRLRERSSQPVGADVGVELGGRQ